MAACSAEDDAQQRDDEVSVLLSIYGDRCVIPVSMSDSSCTSTAESPATSHHAGVTLSIFPKLPTEDSTLTLVTTSCDAPETATTISGKVKYLPPIMVEVAFNNCYPSKEPPAFQIRSWFLSGFYICLLLF